MKRLKRFACLFLAVALMIMCLPMPFRATAIATTVASGECGANATWVLDGDGVLTVSGTGEIGALSNHDYDNSVTTVIINSGITKIGDNAFSGCRNIKSVFIPASVTEIGEKAFNNMALYVDGTHVFYEGTYEQATAISVASGYYNKIGDKEQWHCEAKEIKFEITEKCSVTEIECAYCGMQYVKKDFTHNFVDGICSICGAEECWSYLISSFDGTAIISRYNGTDSAITIPSEIDGFPVTKIWDNAFYDNYTITSIAIPASVNTLEHEFFVGVYNLEKITVDKDNPILSCDSNGVLYNKDKTKLIWVPRSLTGTFDIPSGVTEIGNAAFMYCKKITEINVPDTVTEIGWNSFFGCTGIESIHIPAGVTEIKEQAFRGCSSLKTITIPKNVVTIGTDMGCAFVECDGLTAAYIMNKDAVFGDYAFDLYGDKLANLTIYGYTNSTAQTYAESRNIPFIALDSNLVIIPDLTDTDYTIDSDGSFTVYCSGTLSELQCVKMDGSTVAESNYTLEEGSTIVKFKADYLDTLAEGEHTVTLVYTSGSVDTTISVAANTCEHTYDNTCDTSCNLCGATRTVTHSWGTITSNDTQHWYECTVCGEEKDRENHHGGTATCKDKATCADCGKQYGDLAQCGYTAEVAETKYLKAAATCNTKAIYYKSCPVCGSFGTDTFTAGEFDKTNHKGETEIRGTVPATCGDPGYTGDTYCLDCNTKIATGTATNATGQHSGGTATCKEKAVCTTCGTAYGDFAKCEYTEEIAAAKYLKAAATCKDKAVYYKSCKVCGGVGTETFTYGEVDAANHTGGTEIRDAVAANCSNPGYTGDTYCLGCNAKLATGTATEKNDNHSGGTATCKEKAVCTICGDPYGDFAKHSYTEYKSNNDATCEKDGTKTATCAYGCGTTDTAADVGSAKGHDFKTYTSDKNATCKADGTKTAKCENCDKTNTVADEGSKADHSYGDDNFCDWCGKDKSNPQTGDNTNLVLLTSIMVISLLMVAALIATMYRTKKTR